MATPESSRTKDGFGSQFGVNHLAHFLLFKQLEPTLLASSTPEFQSRVVSVASSCHRILNVHLDDLDLQKTGYDGFKSYGQSKTANVSGCLSSHAVDKPRVITFGPVCLSSLHQIIYLLAQPSHIHIEAFLPQTFTEHASASKGMAESPSLC